MLLIYIYVALASYNTGYLTLPMNSIENVVDEAANIAVIDSKGRMRKGGSEKMRPGAVTAQTVGSSHRRLEWRNLWNEGTDAVMDVPVGGVCEVLYGENRDTEELLTDWPPDYATERRLSSWRAYSK
jgi:phosphatidylinositol glycan class P protein